MILAAGRGERLRPLTDDIPKALVEVRGEILLERHLRLLGESGIIDVVINLGWHGEKIVARIGSGAAYGVNVIYSDEGENVLETGGGIFRALPMLGDGPFLVVNSDVYSTISVPAVELDSGDLGHLVLVPKPEYCAQGDFDVLDGRLREVENPTLTFAGVAIYRPEFFAACTAGRFSLAPMMYAGAAEDRLQGSVHTGLWADIGTPERLAAFTPD
jgi:MurNAc alpha-1-phosphate uridylyltransferase